MCFLLYLSVLNTFYLKMCLIFKKFFISQERLAYASVTDKPWNLRGFHNKVFHHPCVHTEHGLLVEDGVDSSASQSLRKTDSEHLPSYNCLIWNIRPSCLLWNKELESCLLGFQLICLWTDIIASVHSLLAKLVSHNFKWAGKHVDYMDAGWAVSVSATLPSGGSAPSVSM